MILPGPGWLLIEVIEVEAKTKSGVYLSQSAKEQEEPQYGKVKEIGKPDIKEGGVVVDAPSFIISDKEGNPQKLHKLERGDTILFKKLTQHDLGFEDLAMLRFESVIGLKLEEEK